MSASRKWGIEFVGFPSRLMLGRREAFGDDDDRRRRRGLGSLYWDELDSLEYVREVELVARMGEGGEGARFASYKLAALLAVERFEKVCI